MSSAVLSAGDGEVLPNLFLHYEETQQVTRLASGIQDWSKNAMRAGPTKGDQFMQEGLY